MKETIRARFSSTSSIGRDQRLFFGGGGEGGGCIKAAESGAQWQSEATFKVFWPLARFHNITQSRIWGEHSRWSFIFNRHMPTCKSIKELREWSHPDEKHEEKCGRYCPLQTVGCLFTRHKLLRAMHESNAAKKMCDGSASVTVSCTEETKSCCFCDEFKSREQKQ